MAGKNDVEINLPEKRKDQAVLEAIKEYDKENGGETISFGFGDEESKDKLAKQHAFRIFRKEGQAEEFFKYQPYFFDKTGCFWLWNQDWYKWERADDVDILNMINDEIGADVISSKSRSEILNALKQEGRRRIPKDINKKWVQFKNKIYDITNGNSFEASPKWFVTNPINWEISFNPETPIMDSLFKEWVGEEYVETLYEIIAYCILPDYPIHRLFCFIGSGMNGKSCYLRLMKKFIGDHNIASSELDRMLRSNFETTKIYKKLVCQMGETNFNVMSQTSILKKITGQDVVGFEYKNKQPFDDINYAKIIIATNNLPTTTDKTRGFYRRWCIVKFPNEFKKENDILSKIPDEEYNNLATRSLITLKKLLDKMEFTNEGSIEAREKTYEDHSNPWDKFMKEHVKEDSEKSITKAQFKKRFDDWCRANKFRALSEQDINAKMKSKGIFEGRKNIEWFDDDGGRTLKLARVWLDIGWKTE